MKNNFPIRINKYLAQQGFCTRKKADELISQKQVFINDKLAKLGDQVQKEDKIKVRKQKNKYFYYKYYKPRGLLTHSNNKNDLDIIKSIKIKNVFPIGRLDKDSEGLLILTNDGRLTDRLLNPDFNNEKEYEVEVDKELKPSFIKKISKGVLIENYQTKPCSAKIIDSKKFNLIITEGKKHQIRRMVGTLNYSVKKLKRTRILDIHLNKLKPGELEKIEGKNLKNFLEKVGLEEKIIKFSDLDN